MSTAAYRRDETAAKDSDCDAGKDPESIDEHVADFELSPRHQLLTKLQCHAQQYHGQGRREGERPSFDGQERQQGQPGVGAEVQHLGADRQDCGFRRSTGGVPASMSPQESRRQAGVPTLQG